MAVSDGRPFRLMPEAAAFISHCCHRCWERERSEFAVDAFIPLRMIVCNVCGNKRCPKATNHLLACTESNEPGQPGSVYR